MLTCVFVTRVEAVRAIAILRSRLGGGTRNPICSVSGQADTTKTRECCPPVQGIARSSRPFGRVRLSGFAGCSNRPNFCLRRGGGWVPRVAGSRCRAMGLSNDWVHGDLTTSELTPDFCSGGGCEPRRNVQGRLSVSSTGVSPSVRLLFSMLFASAIQTGLLRPMLCVRLGGGRHGIQSVRVPSRADTIQGIGNACFGALGAGVSACSARLGFPALLERTGLRFLGGRPLTRRHRGSLGRSALGREGGESRAGRTQLRPLARRGVVHLRTPGFCCDGTSDRPCYCGCYATPICLRLPRPGVHERGDQRAESGLNHLEWSGG